LGRPACQRCELILSPLSPSPSLAADADRWSCADTRAIAQRELSEPVTFEREATPAVFRFGGNHSPRGVQLRQVGPIAFASVSGPLTKLSSGEPGGSARREARWRSRSYIQVGRRGNAVGSCRRRHWPRLGPARESKRTKVCHAPLRRGAPRGSGTHRGAPRRAPETTS
jgi:hypothetical protein